MKIIHILRFILFMAMIAALTLGLALRFGASDIPYDDVGAPHHLSAGLQSMLWLGVGGVLLLVNLLVAFLCRNKKS